MLIPSSLLEHFIVFACLSVFRRFFYCVLIPVRLLLVPRKTVLFITLLLPSFLPGYRPTLFPKHFDFPRITNSAYLRQAAEDIISILSKKKAISSHPSLSFGTPIPNAYLQVARFLRRAVQTPPTPPPHLPPNIDKLPSSLPRMHTPSFPRLKTLPLPRVPTSNPHRYHNRHTFDQQHRPIIATNAVVIDTNTVAKSSLQTLCSGPKKATWEICTGNDFSA